MTILKIATASAVVAFYLVANYCDFKHGLGLDERGCACKQRTAPSVSALVRL